MKRSEFIKSAGLGILGISLFPSIALGSDNSQELIQIPCIKEHVRHGQFQLNTTINDSISNSIERHVFYKNGHSPSNEDMHILKLNVNNETLIINQINTSISITYGENTHLISSNKNDKINLDKETVVEVVKLNSGEKISLTPLKNNSYLVPISGDCSIKNDSLLNNVLSFKSTAHNIEAKQTSSLLIIHC